jgi:SAM-dependent methyltransferase
MMFAIAASVVCALPLAAQVPFLLSQSKPPVNRLAPGVPSPQNVVEKMLMEVGVKANEMVYDLGSGDGRVVITAAQKFGARAVGVEISPKEVKVSRDRIADAKLDRRVKIIEGDLLQVDLSEADVVTIYLLTASNDLIRPNLEKFLKPGARVVSHDYPVRGWQPNRVVEVDSYKRLHHLYIYEMPPKKE